MRGAALVCLLLAGCDDGPRLAPWDLESGTLEDDGVELEQIFQEIERLIGARSCFSADECAALPYGMPCQYFYLAYSTRLTDTDALKEKVTLYDWLDEFRHLKWHMSLQSCVLPPPVISCTSGRCEAD